MTTILIILMLSNGKVAATTQEFSNPTACRAAMEWVIAHGVVRAKCFPKRAV